MKILFVSSRYPPYIGGAQTQLQILAKEISDKHDVNVVIRSNAEKKHKLWLSWLFRAMGFLRIRPRAIECLGLEGRSFQDGKVQVEIPAISLGEKIKILLSNGRSASKIFESKLRQFMHGVDIVHCVKPDWFSLAAARAAAEENVPVAIAPYMHGKTASKEVTQLLQNADIVFSLSDTDEGVLAELGVEARKIKRMGVAPLISLRGDGKGFRLKHGLNDAPIVLFVGRMIEYKGPKALLRASKLVWREVPTARFVFVGPPVGDSDLWFDGVPDKRIRYLGMVSEDEKADAIAACDILCMPSKYEILPAVYLEAWSYGKPVIGGTAFGLKELIEGNGAGFISSHDSELLAAAIVRLLSDRKLRRDMGQAGKALLDREFSVGAIARRMTAAYEEVLRPQRHASKKIAAAG